MLLFRFPGARARLFESEGAPAGGAPAAPAGAPPAEAGAPATPEAAGGDTPATPEGAKPWHETLDLTNDTRDWATRKGLFKDEDPSEAVMKAMQGWANAEKHIGKPAEQIMDRPDPDKPITEWMKSNPELFGIPEGPDGYELKTPDLPEGMEYDTAMEAAIRATAHEQGIPAAALQPLVDTYAKVAGEAMQRIDTQMDAMKADMMKALEADWGEQTKGKLAAARQAMDAVAENAGFDATQKAALAEALKPSIGDAGIMRLFSSIGDMMGEDSLKGRGTPSFGMTPAEASQKLAQMRAPDGAYGKAYASGNRAEMDRLKPEIEALTKAAAQGR